MFDKKTHLWNECQAMKVKIKELETISNHRLELLGDIHEAIIGDYVRELLGHPWHKLTERIEEGLGDE